MTEAKLIAKTDLVCEDLLYYLRQIDALTEEGKLRLRNKLKEVMVEVNFKKIDWSDN